MQTVRANSRTVTMIGIRSIKEMHFSFLIKSILSSYCVLLMFLYATSDLNKNT